MSKNIKAYYVPLDLFTEPSLIEVSAKSLEESYNEYHYTDENTYPEFAKHKLPTFGNIVWLTDLDNTEEDLDCISSNIPDGLFYGNGFLVNYTNITNPEEAPVFESLTDKQIDYLNEYFLNVRYEYASTYYDLNAFAQKNRAKFPSDDDMLEDLIYAQTRKMFLNKKINMYHWPKDEPPRMIELAQSDDFEQLFETQPKIDYISYFENFGLKNIYIIHDGLSDFNPENPDFFSIFGDYYFVKMVLPYNFDEESEYNLSYCYPLGKYDVMTIKLHIQLQENLDINDEFDKEILMSMVSSHFEDDIDVEINILDGKELKKVNCSYDPVSDFDKPSL